MILKPILVFLSTIVLTGCSIFPPQRADLDMPVESDLPTVNLEGKFVVDQEAPVFTTQTLSGESISSTEIIGSVPVILDFWAAWCPSCTSEMPALNAASLKYADQIKIIGVHRTDTENARTAQDFVSTLGASYQFIKDDGSLYNATGGIGMPIAVMIDAQGIVHSIKPGPKSTEQIEKLIGELLEE